MTRFDDIRDRKQSGRSDDRIRDTGPSRFLMVVPPRPQPPVRRMSDRYGPLQVTDCPGASEPVGQFAVPESPPWAPPRTVIPDRVTFPVLTIW